MHPNNLSSDDSNDDYNAQATIFQQQIYNDFQMPADLIENYNYHDNDFIEPDDQIHATLDRLVFKYVLNISEKLFKISVVSILINIFI